MVYTWFFSVGFAVGVILQHGLHPIVLLLCDKGSRKQSLSNSPADTQIESGRLPISAAWALKVHQGKGRKVETSELRRYIMWYNMDCAKEHTQNTYLV